VTNSEENSVPDTGGQDFVTVLTANGRRLTKLVRPGPEVIPYDEVKWFRGEARPVRSLADAAELIDGLDEHQAIVRGRIREGVDRNRMRRLLHDDPPDLATLEPQPLHLVLIDIDGDDIECGFSPVGEPERAAELLVEMLPAEFRGVDVHWRLTASAGIKPGVRMRLVFWASRPLTEAELVAWLGGVPGVDPELFKPVQLVYGDPVFAPGADDPVPRRSGTIVRGRPAVEPPPEWQLAPATHYLPPDEDAPPEAGRQPSGGDGRLSLRSRGAAGQLAAWAAEVASREKGGRQKALNKRTFMAGQMVGAGWLEERAVVEAMEAACTANKLMEEDPQTTRSTIRNSVRAGMRQPADDDGRDLVIDRVVIIRDGERTSWGIWVAGAGRVEMPAADAFDQKRFNKHSATWLNRAWPVVPQNAWIDFMNEASDRAEVAAPAPSTSLADEFLGELEEFLTNRQRGRQREDLLAGRPWEDEEESRHYFRMQDLVRFLERERSQFRAEPSRRLGQRVRMLCGAALGKNPVDTRIKGKKVDLWWVPSDAVVETPELPVPPVPSHVISGPTRH
jgi:hypothetical protein